MWSYPQQKSPPRVEAGRAEYRGAGLLFADRVAALAGLILQRFDLEPVLLGGGGEEASDAVGLPGNRFHNLGQSRPLGPPDQRQDLRALALRARLSDRLGADGPGYFFEGAFFPPLAVFWPLGAPFFGLAPFFEDALSGATVALCSATVAAVLVCSLFILVSFPLLRLVGA